jgi:signal transduction protein with GAF and PtsI domain
MPEVPAVPTSKRMRRLSKSTDRILRERIKRMQNLTERIVSYEKGELTDEQTFQLFQELVDSGLIMKLQGHYQRLAAQLLEAGLIT